MNILFITSEVAGLAKTGGLGDVSAALPRALLAAGHDARVFMPFYGSIETKGLELEMVIPELDVSLGPRSYRVQIILARRPDAAPVHLVACPQLYHRGSLYTGDPDEHVRFLALSRAALESAQRLGFAPDVVHCNDWQSALVPLTLKVRYDWDRLLSRTKTLLTIHNLNYQGIFPAEALADTGLADAANLFHQDQLRGGRINSLLHGILYADGVSTVSPTYAKEIQTPKQGVGLDPFLRARSSTVIGILNGVDYDEWSPEKDRHIPHHFGVHDRAGKLLDKRALLERLGLPFSERVPVVGIVSRLAGQKGFALLQRVAPALLRKHDFQLTVLGSGERRFERFFASLAETFPKKVAFHRGFSNPLAHLIEAGADMFLMPSVYEPCGLNQMYSLRYGTVPIVHATGGLADTVQIWDPDTRTGTGVVFDHHDAEGLRWAIEAALGLYGDQAAWQQIVENGMKQDFSWGTQTKLYELVYARLQGKG